MTGNDASPNIKTLPVWDKGLALAQLDGNTQLLDRIVKLYIDKVEEIFIELEFFINNAHLKEIFPLAHDLKDLSRSVGAIRIAEIALMLESEHTTLPTEQLKNAYTDLENEFQAFKQAHDEPA